MRPEMLSRLEALMGRVRTVAWIEGEAPSLDAACASWMDKWLTLRAELAAERCENCVSVTLEHDNGTTVFCAHPEMWDNRDRDFYCAYFGKRGS